MSMLRVAGDRGRICPFSPRTIIRWILPEPGKVGVPSFEVGVLSATMVLPSLIAGAPFDIPVASVDPGTERGEESLGGVPFDIPVASVDPSTERGEASLGGVPFDIPVASVDPRTERGEESLGGVPFDLGELPSSCLGGVPLTILKTAFLNQEHTILQ